MITLLCGALGIIFTFELYALNELRKRELIILEAQEREWQQRFDRMCETIGHIENFRAGIINVDNLEARHIDASAAAVVNLSHMSQS